MFNRFFAKSSVAIKPYDPDAIKQLEERSEKYRETANREYILKVLEFTRLDNPINRLAVREKPMFGLHGGQIGCGLSLLNQRLLATQENFATLIENPKHATLVSEILIQLSLLGILTKKNRAKALDRTYDYSQACDFKDLLIFLVEKLLPPPESKQTLEEKSAQNQKNFDAIIPCTRYTDLLFALQDAARFNPDWRQNSQSIFDNVVHSCWKKEATWELLKALHPRTGAKSNFYLFFGTHQNSSKQEVLNHPLGDMQCFRLIHQFL